MKFAVVKKGEANWKNTLSRGGQKI